MCFKKKKEKRKGYNPNVFLFWAELFRKGANFSKALFFAMKKPERSSGRGPHPKIFKVRAGAPSSSFFGKEKGLFKKPIFLIRVVVFSKLGKVCSFFLKKKVAFLITLFLKSREKVLSINPHVAF